MSVNQATLLDGITVPVGVSSTDILAATDVRTLPATLAVTLQNADAGQTLEAWAEGAPTSTGPWAALQWTELQAMAPGEVRVGSLDVVGRQWVRIRGQASGAGLNAVVWVFRVDR